MLSITTSPSHSHESSAPALPACDNGEEASSILAETKLICGDLVNVAQSQLLGRIEVPGHEVETLKSLAVPLATGLVPKIDSLELGNGQAVIAEGKGDN